MKRRAVLYSRVSTQGQSDDGVSLDMQEAMARRRCEQEGWEYVGTYTDVMSGGKTKRPSLMRLEADAEAKKFEVVIVYHSDRLARTLLKLLQVAAHFKDLGIHFVSLTEAFDTTTDAGEAMLAMSGAFAQLEARRTAARVRDSMRLIAARGEPTGTVTRALGYRYDAEAKKLLVVADEAPLVREIFDTYQALRSYRATADTLNQRGHRTLNGKLFTAPAVRWIIRNPTYAGVYAWGRTATSKNSKGQRKQTALPPEKWIAHEGHHEALILLEEWQAIQAIADETARLHPRGVYSRRKHPWATLLRCACCDGAANSRIALQPERKDGTRTQTTYYTCINRKSKGVVGCDAPFFLTSTYLDREVVPAISRALARASMAQRGEAKPRRATRSNAQEIAALQGEIDRAFDLYVKGRWSYEKAEQVEAQAKARIAALQNDEAAPSAAIAPIENFADLYGKATEALRGDLLRLYVARVEAGKERVKVFFRPETGGVRSLNLKRKRMSGWYGASLKGKRKPT